MPIQGKPRWIHTAGGRAQITMLPIPGQARFSGLPGNSREWMDPVSGADGLRKVFYATGVALASAQ